MNKYVCARCRLQVLSNWSAPTPRTRLTASICTNQHNQRGLITGRLLHTKQSQRAAVSTAASYEPPSPTADVLTSSKSGLQYEDPLNGTPFIRDHLRAWMTDFRQNEEAERADTIPERGRIYKLPDSLFVNQLEPEYESEQVEDDLADFNAMVEGNARNQMEPGDLCQLKPPHARRQLAVFIGQAGLQLLYLLTNGRYCQIRPAMQDSITIPAFASQEEVAAVREQLPKQHILRDASSEMPVIGDFLGELPTKARDKGLPVVQRLQEFDREVLEFRRLHTEFLDSLYERLAEEDRFVRIPFEHFVQNLLGPKASQISDAGRMAIFLMAQRNPTKILLWQLGRNLNLHVLLGPKEMVRRFSSVVEWAREYQETAALASKGRDVRGLLQENPVSKFINKARKIILASRKLRSPTTIGCLGPSQQNAEDQGKVVARSSGEEFTESDRSILDFIHDTYIRQPGSKSMTKHHAIASLILRAIGAYPKMALEDNIGRLLLQELGAMPPWAEAADDDVTFPIPGRRGAHQVTEKLAEAEKLAKELGFGRGAQKLPLSDSMAHLRKDLGSMEVFVIDKLGTDVFDDGISFEPSTERPGCHWVHVHVAHPSAFIGKDTIFGQLAKAQGSSWYTTKVSYPMLPAAVGQSMSLAPGAAALTTSTLLDANGDVVDIKLQPTTIHNIIHLQPEAVDNLLGQPERDMAVLIVGSDPSISVREPAEAQQQALHAAAPYKSKLEQCLNVLRSRQRRRNEEQVETIDYLLEERKGTCKVSSLDAHQPSRLHESLHYIGDPTIKLQAPKRPPRGRWSEFTEVQSIVSQSMILAGESFGKWFQDRELPAIYAGSQTDPAFPISKLNAAGWSDPIIAPKAVERAEPVRHVSMAVPQYIRSTSPLRRFGDLLAQWNADAYLRAEAEGLIKAGQPPPAGFRLPYEKPEINDYIKNDSWITKAGRSLDQDSYAHWAFQALFRAFHFKEAQLPEIWDAQVRSDLPSSATIANLTEMTGTLYPFCHKVRFMRSAEQWEKKAKRGQFLPVRIDMVDATNGCVYVMAVGSPSDEMTQADDKEGSAVYLGRARQQAIEQAEREEARSRRQAALVTASAA